MVRRAAAVPRIPRRQTPVTGEREARGDGRDDTKETRGSHMGRSRKTEERLARRRIDVRPEFRTERLWKDRRLWKSHPVPDSKLPHTRKTWRRPVSASRARREGVALLMLAVEIAWASPS